MSRLASLFCAAPFLACAADPTASDEDAGSCGGKCDALESCSVFETTTGLRLRAQPNTSSETLAIMPANTRVERRDPAPEELDAPGWVPLRFQELNGFSFAEFLRCIDSPDEPVGEVPQYVLISFDGSRNLDIWQRTMDAAMDAGGATFSYFVSGVYFVPEAHRTLYRPPRRDPGTSLIGWADDADDIDSRIARMNEALAIGHEIAVHANGHFDGRNWSLEEWRSELGQFNAFLFGDYVEELAEGAEKEQLRAAFASSELERSDVVGIRAPFLATGDGFFAALDEQGYLYDSSRTLSSTAVPTQSASGRWDIPLAALRIPPGHENSGFLVNSSDVGFHFLHSQQPDGTNTERYQEMLDTYLAYFEENYNGSRAPLRIAHHFTQYWEEEAADDDGDRDIDHRVPYLEALEEFARRVCPRPDVRCTSFSEYAGSL